MITEIISFWNCFSLSQMDLIIANCNGDLRMQTLLFNRVQKKSYQIHPKLNLMMLYRTDGGSSAKCIFLTQGNYKLGAIAEEILKQAPQLENWQFQIGVKPYKKSVVSLCSTYNFIDASTLVYQIYFAIEKVYKTSNKLHLIIYFEMDQKHSKHDLHEAMETIFIWFLGDALYYKHISRFRIIRRKYSAINFIPFDELRNTIQFKSLN